MNDSSSHYRADLARQVLLTVLALAALLIAVSAVRDIQQAIDVRMRWERHPAEVASTARQDEVELEVAADLLPRLGAVRQPEYATPHQSGNMRVRLPAPPYALYDVFDRVDIAFDPSRPGNVRIIDLAAQAAPPAAKLAWLLALAFVAWTVRRARWGEDLTWIEGQWVSTGDTALRARSGATEGHAVVETRASHHGVIFWSSFTGLAAIAVVVWAALNYTHRPIESGSMALGSLCVFGLALFMAVQTFSRRVLHDATGICDATFSRTRRVPWKAIASLRRVNLNEAAQKRYDSQRKRSGSRPRNLIVWLISDAADREILHFSEAM